MVAGVEDAMILANQFLPGVLADGAKLVVHVGNRALDVSHGDDRMLIEGKLLIDDIFFASFAIGNIGTDSHVLAGFAPLVHEGNDGSVYPVDRAILGPVLNLAVPHLPV